MIHMQRSVISFFFLFILLGGCAKLPENIGRTGSYSFPVPAQSELSQKLAPKLESHPGESAYLLLSDGLDAFVARAAIAQIAEYSIDAQYYLLNKDTLGALFMDQLFKAAKRGVRVRLLLDDMGLDGRDFSIAVLNEHPNVEIRIFNPFARNIWRTLQFLTGFGKQTRRSHNKSFTIDSVATIVGGRNIGDEYFVANPYFSFLDLDVLAVGPIVREVSDSFDLYWNHELSYPVSTLVSAPEPEDRKQAMEQFETFIGQQKDSVYVKRLQQTEFVKAAMEGMLEFDWGPGVVVADKPDKLQTDTDNRSYHLSEELGPHLEGVTEELLIFSPYFIPGKSGVAFLQTLRDRGVAIKIITNSLASTDVAIVHSGYANYRRDLLRMGVELYELNKKLGKEQREQIKDSAFYETKASLHAKAICIDRKKVFIGSLNLDPRSVFQNTEIGIIFESDRIADELGLFFDEYAEKVAFRLELRSGEDGFEYLVWHGLVDGEKRKLYSEPYASTWERFMMNILRLVPAESQL